MVTSVNTCIHNFIIHVMIYTDTQPIGLIKTTYKAEHYVLKVKSTKQRSAMSRFRCGVAPINLEIGRFFNIPANERFCNFCSGQVEDEAHVILECPMYDQLRKELFVHAMYIHEGFMQMSKEDKLVFLFTECKITQRCAKTCYDILTIRKNVMATICK